MISDDMAMKIATFRFGVIADFVTGARLAYGERARLIQEKANRGWNIPASTRTTVSRATILLWISLYKKAGFRIEGLMPKKRKDEGSYKKLDSTLRMAIKDLKQENPTYTVPVVITKLKHAKIIGSEDRINKASIYRFIKKEKLDEISEHPKDKRKFEASFPNEIWQCDVMHGPMVKQEKGPQKKSYLCAIMDDHSRLIVSARFYLNETLGSLKDCLKHGLLSRGLPGKFYVDNGACYKALNLEQILASLGIGISHSRPYTPQGRGKIERWFRYVRQDFIPVHAHKPLSLDLLNERFESWVDGYNDSVHSAIKSTPYDRFKKDMTCIRPAPENLEKYFRKIEFRKVKKDRTVQMGGCLYEVPVGLIDKKVELHFHEENLDDIEIFFEGHSYGKALTLDPHLNARVGRDYGSQKKESDQKTSQIPLDTNIVSSGRLFPSRSEDHHEHDI